MTWILNFIIIFLQNIDVSSEIKDRGTVGAFTGILTVVTISSAIRLAT